MRGFNIMQISVLVLDYLHWFVHCGENWRRDFQRTPNYVGTNVRDFGDYVITEPVQGGSQFIGITDRSRYLIVGVGVTDDVRPSCYCL
jgi:hypothetical protein